MTTYVRNNIDCTDWCFLLISFYLSCFTHDSKCSIVILNFWKPIRWSIRRQGNRKWFDKFFSYLCLVSRWRCYWWCCHQKADRWTSFIAMRTKPIPEWRIFWESYWCIPRTFISSITNGWFNYCSCTGYNNQSSWNFSRV